MESTNTIVANAMAAKALNAKYNHTYGPDAKVGDRVRVRGALGTYIVTKVQGDWIEIKDANDGTPQGRVEARFAFPVKNACGTARNADAASQKLRNEWHNAFQSMKRLYDAAKSEGHKAIMDAANAATKMLMDKTQSLGFS